MDTSTVNLILNIVAVVLGGGALWSVLKYRLGARKLDLDGEEAIRDHYANEVAALRGQLASMEEHYRRMLSDSDRRHEECQIDRDKLRDRVRQLENHLEGLESQIRQYSTDRLLVLETRAPPSESAPHSLGAAKRVRGMIDPDEGDGR